jgi:polysaccharide chain length determinant protein (PEP-CTERM system associated)
MSSTTIVVEDKRVIQPLMEGAAVATSVADRARLAREILHGRKVMNQILEVAGWMKDNPSLEQQDKIIKLLTAQTSITNVGRDIIRIQYKDSDPERVFLTTKKLAELLISESHETKAAESKSAFDFIYKQTEEYHAKLINAEEQLKEFRSANLDTRPGSDVGIGARVGQLQGRIDQTSQDLKEAEVRKISLEKQLSGEAEVATVLSREGQFRSRIAELQSRLETLRLSYHETYPDVVQLKHQIADLNQAIIDERKRREEAKAAGRITIDESVINNPQYQQLRHELTQTKINIDMLTARIAVTRRDLAAQIDRGKRVHGGEATLAELTRDYQVNRDIYQDLLRRRENARVSMNLDMDNRGLAIKVQEPAVFPREPSGLRFVHFIIVGFVLAIALPLGLLYTRLYSDPRIRRGSIMVDKRKLPLLAVVPHLWSPSDIKSVRQELEWILLAFSGTVLFVLVLAVLRHVRVI